MITIRIITIILILLSSYSLVFAEIPSPLRDVMVSSDIEIESTGFYVYRYTISNPPINNGQIVLVQIDISIPSDSSELNSAGLVIEEGLNWEGKMLTTSFSEVMKNESFLMEKEIVPVGVQVPLGWSGGIAVMGTILWGGSEKDCILPGHSLDDFVVKSYGVPGIREITLEPAIDYDNLPEEYYENVELTKQLKDSLTFRTKTIGPTAPPEELVPADFLQGIIEMKHQAMELGWVTNEGVKDSLDMKLDAALKKFQSGNTKAAKNILGAFINEVEAQGCESYDDCPKGKHLTPEAYALLKFNAQYLIDNLK